MTPCFYYKELTGITGDCTVNPPVYTSAGWNYPTTRRTCHCQFHKDRPVEVKKVKTARQKLIEKKKLNEGK